MSNKRVTVPGARSMGKAADTTGLRAKGGTARLGGILSALARDARGNTLALMAAILIPLAAFSGSAIDVARLYVVKVRLQQSCDAGVLAGRKFMTDSSSSTALDSTATTQAKAFFANNFKTGWFTTGTVSFTPTKTSDSQVAGTASATVPMTIMKMFGMQPIVLNVACEARYDVADTDVMFVLDTTGSMSCLPTESESACSTYVGAAGTTAYTRPDGTQGYYVPEKSGSRISYLRSAVLNFYDTLYSNIDPSTHVRYGFVTYTSTVNSGASIYALSPSYLVDSYDYESRIVTADYTISSSTATNSSITTKANCDALDSRTPSTALTYDPSTGTATKIDATWTTPSGKSPYCSVVTYKLGPTWTYKQRTLPTTDYVKTVSSGSITDPTKVNGATTKWQGCVEERDTTTGTKSFDTSSLPGDLDPDLIPTSAATRWRPMWPDAVYQRNSSNGIYGGSTNVVTSNGDDSTGDPKMTDAKPMQYGYMTCGKPVLRLATMTRTEVSNYVNATDFRAIGGTYHDTGMIWGTRMIAPNGVYKNDTLAWPGRQAPNRVIVFVTDGDMAPNAYIYGMYGIEYYDKRIANGDTSNLKDYHNARFLAECTAAKDRNIDVWVVAVGQSLTDELKACATTTDQALYAGTGDDLSSAFATIAKQVAMLRISK